MERARHLLYILILCAGCLFISVRLEAQKWVVGPPFDTKPTSYLYKWDPLRQSIIFYRSRSSEISPAVRIASSLRQSSLAITPLSELTQLDYIAIWDVSATPDGGAVLAVILKSAQRRVLTPAILVYDENGHLSQLWETLPYEHHRLTVGADGSVYALGERNDVPTTGSAANDMPLLIHYSKDGKVIDEGLRLSQFPKGIDIAGADATTEMHHMSFLPQGTLLLYLSTTKEVLLLASDLKILQRVSLVQPLDKLANTIGSSMVQVSQLCANGERIYAQVTISSGQAGGRDISKRLVQFDSKTSSWNFVSTDTDTSQQALLDVSNDGRLLFMETQPNGETLLSWTNIRAQN